MCWYYFCFNNGKILGFIMYIFNNIQISKQENPYRDRNEGDEGERFYFCLAEISSGVVDTDGHIMGRSTLENFARDATSGVQVKDSHEFRNGFGRTFDGVYEEVIDSEGRVLSGLRISRGMPLDGKSYSVSDGFIQAILDEVITQVSIGAYGGQFVCNICNAFVYESYDCYHWPLRTYDIADDDGNKQEVECTWTYIDGRLRELSLVDCGACPGAGIIEARLESQLKEGRISAMDAGMVKSMYQLPERSGYSFPSELSGSGGAFGSGVDGGSDTSSVDIGNGVDDGLSKGSKDSKVKGDIRMDLEQATQRISELEGNVTKLQGEVTTLKADNATKDARIAELSDVEAELATEKSDLRNGLLDLWKGIRDFRFTGEELTRYEKRLDSMDIWNLKLEKEQLEQIDRMQNPEKYADGTNSADDGGEGAAADGGEGASGEGSEGSEGSDPEKSNRKTTDDPKKSVGGSGDDDLDRNRPPKPSGYGR